MTPVLLASLILTNPDPKAIDGPCPPDRFLVMAIALRKVAVGMELVDGPESQWYFNNVDSYSLDIGILRDKYLSVNDAPRLWEAERFRVYNFDEAIRVIEAEQERLGKLDRLRLIDYEVYSDIHAELEYRRQMYRRARDAVSTYYNYSTRKEALKWLRTELTPHQWKVGRLPHPLPYHD